MSEFRTHLKEIEQADFTMEKLFESQNLEDIGKELGITRQGVNNTLRRGVKKMWKSLKELDIEASDLELLLMLGQGLKMKNIQSFYAYLPSDAKKSIETEAKAKNITIKK